MCRAGGSIFRPSRTINSPAAQSSSQYQYTLYSDNTAELYQWAQKLTDALIKRGRLKDVVSDQKIKALETDLVIDRDAAARFGLNQAMIDNTIYDAFGQRQVSIIFSSINQYHVVMEIDPRYTQSPAMLDQIYVSTAGGAPNAVALSNLPGGAVTQKPPAGASASRRRRLGESRFRPQRHDQCAGRLGQKLGLRRRGGQHDQGDDDSAVARSPYTGAAIPRWRSITKALS